MTPISLFKNITFSDLKKFSNSQPSVSNFKSFSRSLKQFFLTASQNNFGNKIPLCSFSSSPLVLWCQHMQQSSEFYSFFTESENGFREQQWLKKINYHGRFLLAWLQHYTSAKLCQYAQSHYFSFQCGLQRSNLFLKLICKP